MYGVRDFNLTILLDISFSFSEKDMHQEPFDQRTTEASVCVGNAESVAFHTCPYCPHCDGDGRARHSSHSHVLEEIRESEGCKPRLLQKNIGTISEPDKKVVSGKAVAKKSCDHCKS